MARLEEKELQVLIVLKDQIRDISGAEAWQGLMSKDQAG